MGRFTLGTGLANEEWTTWAGDAGSAAAEFAVDTYANTATGRMADYFNRFAGVDDLLGDVDAFAIRAGLSGLAPGRAVGNSREAYGGILSGSTLTNRPALEAALQPSIDNFAADSSSSECSSGDS